MARMTGGQAVVAALVAEGVDTVFGIPGYHNVALYDALFDRRDLRHITCRHEQGAGLMAVGYALSSGRPGVLLTTTGPGAFNTATALGEAWGESAPVLTILAANESFLLHRFKGAFHESKDQSGIFDRLSSWYRFVPRVEDIPYAVREAMRFLHTRRPGPATIEIPSDLFAAEGEVATLPPERFVSPAPDDRQIERAAAILSRAQRPLLWAGGGLTSARAEEALRRLAERLGAPVLLTSSSRGALPEAHPLLLGNLGWHSPVKAMLQEADAMLAVGTRFGQGTTVSWTLPMPRPLIHLDIDGAVIARSYETELGIVADARLGLERLVEALGPGEGTGWGGQAASRVAEARRLIDSRLDERAPEMRAIMRALRAAAPPDTIVSCDPTVISYWARQHFPVDRPRSFLYPNGFGALGPGLPFGLGARVAHPGRPVLVLAGDGGFLFTAQELATAMLENLPVTVVVFNDHAYGVIRETQDRRFGGRRIAVSLRNPDYPAFAASFGFAARRVVSAEELEQAVREGLTSGKPHFIEMPLEIPRNFPV